MTNSFVKRLFILCACSPKLNYYIKASLWTSQESSFRQDAGPKFFEMQEALQWELWVGTQNSEGSLPAVSPGLFFNGPEGNIESVSRNTIGVKTNIGIVPSIHCKYSIWHTLGVQLILANIFMMSVYHQHSYCRDKIPWPNANVGRESVYQAHSYGLQSVLWGTHTTGARGSWLQP